MSAGSSLRHSCPSMAMASQWRAVSWKEEFASVVFGPAVCDEVEVVVGAFCVELVANDREADVREVDADLVGAAGEGPGSDERELAVG